MLGLFEFMKRIAYCSDLHGDEAKYQKFYTVEADYHVIGGDLFPKRGYFTKLPEKQKNFLSDFLRPLLEKYKETTKTFLMIGNDDVEPLERVLLEWQDEGLCYYLHGNKFKIEEFELIGFKYIPPTPFSIKNLERRDSRGITQKQFATAGLFQNDDSFLKVDFYAFLKSQPSIAELLEALPKPTNFSKAIYVMHSPPYDTLLDQTVNNEAVGSQDIRDFILTYQPALVFCGHIHESPGTTKLGRTTCINPGHIYDFNYSVIELEKDTIHFQKIPPVLNKKT